MTGGRRAGPGPRRRRHSRSARRTARTGSAGWARAGFSPSSQRRTREVSVEMWLAPNWRARRLTWRASSPLDQPLRTNHEPSSSLGRLSRAASAPVPLPPLPPTGTPPSLRPLVAECAKPYQNAGKYGRPSGSSHPSNGKPTCLRHTHKRMCPQASCTQSNPTITPPAMAIPETPPFATPSNELTVARTAIHLTQDGREWAERCTRGRATPSAPPGAHPGADWTAARATGESDSHVRVRLVTTGAPDPLEGAWASRSAASGRSASGSSRRRGRSSECTAVAEFTGLWGWDVVPGRAGRGGACSCGRADCPAPGRPSPGLRAPGPGRRHARRGDRGLGASSPAPR